MHIFTNAKIQDSRPALPRARFFRLVGRAIDLLRHARCNPADQEWVWSILMPAEFDLWTKLPAHDQYHTVRVAQKVQQRLAQTQQANDDRWLGAALMHDIGKLESNLSGPERVIANLVGKSISLSKARRWATAGSGLSRRIGLYLIHGSVGAEMLRATGARNELAAWAEVHQEYQFPAGLKIPRVVIRALSDSD